MGLRGTKAKPASLHKKQNTFRADRHTDPGIKGSVPPAPAWLGKEALAEWNRLADELAEADLLSSRYMMAFASYCQCVADFKKYQAILDKEGEFILTKSKNLIQHPALGARGKCLDRMIKLQDRFGMTPSAATSIKNSPEEKEDALEKLIKERQKKKADAKIPVKKAAPKKPATRGKK